MTAVSDPADRPVSCADSATFQLGDSFHNAQSAESIAAIHDGKAEVNGVLYHYLLAKSHGDPLVLPHGWGSTSYMWRFVMPQLAARGYTVLAPDLRGRW